MVAIDTNVLLRLLLDDDPAQSARIDAWLDTLPAVPDQILVCDLVLAETVWTLSSAYAQPQAELLKALRGLLAEPMFCFERREVLMQAVDRFETARCGFADCLIAARHAALGCSATASFDKRMRSLPGVQAL